MPTAPGEDPEGGRPVSYDPVLYKNRNVVERPFAILKQWRGLAARYDRHAVTYRGAAVLGAIIVWLRALGGTP